MVKEEDLSWVVGIWGWPTVQYAGDIELYTLNLYNLINQCHPNKSD